MNYVQSLLPVENAQTIHPVGFSGRRNEKVQTEVRYSRINAYLFRFAAALCSSKSRESSSVVVVVVVLVVVVSMCPPSFKLVLLNVNGRVFFLLLRVM